MQTSEPNKSFVVFKTTDAVVSGHRPILLVVMLRDLRKKEKTSQGCSSVALATVCTASLQQLWGFFPSCDEMGFGVEGVWGLPVEADQHWLILL